MIESQIVARVLPSKCREAVKVLLQEVYGYEDFRNLEVYDDLFKGKEKLQLSQGQLIEGSHQWKLKKGSRVIRLFIICS